MNLSRVPPHAVNGLEAMNKDKALVKAGIEAKDIIDRYCDGRSIAKQAEEYGVSTVALTMKLLRNAESDWKEAQIGRAIVALEECEQEIEDATDGVSVSRARERARMAQWKLERLYARLFAQKQEVTHSGNPQFTINIGQNQSGNVIVDGKVVGEV